MAQCVLGVDIGGSQIRSAIFDIEGQLLFRTQTTTPGESGPQAVIDSVLDRIAQALSSGRGDVAGIGIGVPGPADPDTGKIYYPPNLPGWGTRSILDPVRDQFGLPTFVGNDANVAALGEQRFGAGKGILDLLYVTISTGIGGGIVSGGRLLTGWRGFAAEIGHQTLVIDGPKCSCGQRGHLEALASGPAIARYVIDAVRDGRKSIVKGLTEGPEEITAAHVAEAAQQGDSLASEAFQTCGMYIGIGLANLIHILEPQLILLGGGVTNAGDVLFDPIRSTVREHVMSEIFQNIAIERARLGDDVGLYGAAALALVGIEG
jgi:glucokinase